MRLSELAAKPTSPRGLNVVHKGSYSTNNPSWIQTHPEYTLLLKRKNKS